MAEELKIVQGLADEPHLQLANTPFEAMRRTELFAVAVSRNLLSANSAAPKKDQLLRILEENVPVSDVSLLREAVEPVPLNTAHLAQESKSIVKENEDEDIFGFSQKYSDAEKVAVQNKYLAELNVPKMMKMFKEDFPDSGVGFAIGSKKVDIVAAVVSELNS